MEAGEESGGNSLKRQRAPLSDSEDNILIPSEGKDGQKRRRLEAAGRENHSPKQSSRLQAEPVIKPDTPIIPSVRSRVLQLTQRREEGTPPTQRCLSDPGADSPSAAIHDKGFREHLLGEGEFSQRMERFKLPVCKSDPAPSPANPCPRTRSNLVSGIHQKLQGSPTSSEQASRIRQEREKEFSRLHFQPISENPWLKRSSSDPSLNQQGRTTPGSSSPSSCVPRSKRRFQWPPTQPWDDDYDALLKDGSFTEAPTPGAGKLFGDSTGEGAPCDSEAPAASSSEGQLQMEWKKQNTLQVKEVKEKGKDYKASVGNEKEHGGSNQQESQPVMMLSFSEDQSFSKASYVENQNVSGDEQGLLDFTQPGESDMKETCEVSKVTEQSSSDMLSLEEDEKINDSSYGEEDIEPSSDEELRLWRYPQHKVYQEKELNIAERQEGVCSKDEEEALVLSRVEMKRGGHIVDDSDPSAIQGSECYLTNVSADIAGSSALQEDEKLSRDTDEFQSKKCLDDSVEYQSALNRDQENMESYKGCYEGEAKEDIDILTTRQDQKNTKECTHVDDVCQQSKEIQTVYIKEEDMDLDSTGTVLNSRVKVTEASPCSDVAQVAKETQTGHIDVQSSAEDVAQLKARAYAEPLDIDTHDAPSAPVHLLETEEKGQEAVDVKEDVTHGPTEETHKAEGRESSKKVTFILEPELINDETNNSVESRTETSTSDVELSSHDETNTAEIIDQMFEEVLEYAGRVEEERGTEDAEDRDSGIVACSRDTENKMDTDSEKEKREEEAKEECDELLTFPPSGILSPLSKSVEAVVTPLRLAVSQESNPPSLLLTPEETSTPPAESAPLYSIDAYRTQTDRQSKLPTIQSVTPGVQRRAPEKSQTQQSVNTKERIAALNEEAGKLQTVINQTLQALSCCTDEEHGQGSLEEAEAEKLLLVSCEKRSSLLAEVARLREERNSESGEGEDREYVSQQPCRGTVSITNIQLPLKVEFVCSSHGRTGRPSHYFFVLIRYGPCNIVATPLATAADAQNGDTISFPTSVTLKDIRSAFEIDVEVYSLSHTSGNNSSIDRTTTKSRVTPRKLLNTITRSSNTLTSAALPTLNARRSSNFSLVGCHKITLASLGHSKFPLDKMKLEGKIRRLLGDEFQEKVPFLSPLEGNIYLQLHSEGHSNVQHQGFLTMFELISGYGVWHRRYFVLEGCNMYYWNHPNDKESKEAEGSMSLSSSPSQCVRPVKRDSCARPFTFELVSSVPHQQQDEREEALAKCWFSADTKQERLDWMEKLNQALLDFHTWNRTSAAQTESQQSTSSSSGNLRESIL